MPIWLGRNCSIKELFFSLEKTKESIEFDLLIFFSKETDLKSRTGNCFFAMFLINSSYFSNVIWLFEFAFFTMAMNIFTRCFVVYAIDNCGYYYVGVRLLDVVLAYVSIWIFCLPIPSIC